MKVRKEECLTHVTERLKKNLKKIKPNTKAKTYIQHKWKADYVASNYSIVILQNRGTTPDKLSRDLAFSLIMLQEFILAALLETTDSVDGIDHLPPQHQLRLVPSQPLTFRKYKRPSILMLRLSSAPI